MPALPPLQQVWPASNISSYPSGPVGPAVLPAPIVAGRLFPAALEARLVVQGELVIAAVLAILSAAVAARMVHSASADGVGVADTVVGACTTIVRPTGATAGVAAYDTRRQGTLTCHM